MAKTDIHKRLFESAYLDILYVDNKFLHANWKGYLSVEKVKMGCENLLTCMKNTSCYYLVNGKQFS